MRLFSCLALLASATAYLVSPALHSQRLASRSARFPACVALKAQLGSDDATKDRAGNGERRSRLERLLPRHRNASDGSGDERFAVLRKVAVGALAALALRVPPASAVGTRLQESAKSREAKAKKKLREQISREEALAEAEEEAEAAADAAAARGDSAARGPMIQRLGEEETMAIDEADPWKNRFAVTVGVAFFAQYTIRGLLKSGTIMSSQRKRVRTENTRFKQLAEEFMNVEGEAAIDEDLMRELREMKEKLAGPGDKYAKETRAYGGEEFRKKYKEADAKEQAKGGAKGKGGAAAPAGETTGSADDDLDLLDTEADSRAEAAAAKEKEEEQRKKREDAAKLQRMFDSSPNDGAKKDDSE